MEQTEGDGFVLDEDIALTNAPQQTFKRRQKWCQYHASNEPSQHNDNNQKTLETRQGLFHHVCMVARSHKFHPQNALYIGSLSNFKNHVTTLQPL